MLNWFTQFSTRAKLYAGFGVMILFLAVVIVAALASLDSIQQAKQFATDLVDVNADLNQQRAQGLAAILAKDKADVEAIRRGIEANAKSIDEALARLTATAQGDPPTARRLDELKETLLAYRAGRQTQFRLVLEGNAEQAQTLAVSSQDDRFSKVRNIVLDLGAKSRDEADRTARSAVTFFCIVGVTGLVVAVGLAILLNQLIAGRLSMFMQFVERVGRGDLTQTAGVQGTNPSASRNELDKLGMFLNQMVVGLRDLTGQTAEVTNSLNTAATEILASTQQQAASTKEQAATVQQITSTMQEIHQSGGQVAERAKQVAVAAEAASVTAQSGLRAVAETNRAMESIREQVEEVAETTVALSEKTQAVGEIIITVSEIAEQSNLLSLNASIEAVSAGEQGGRFAVVANEMKNLADRAKQCTTQVRTILGDIQKGINTSVMLTEEAFKRVESGRQQADLTERTIQQMTATSEQSIQAFQQIISATNQQQIGFDQVTQGMENIRQAASQTAAGTSQLERAVSNVNAVSKQLKTAVGRYQI
ncbi:MAG: methyl-accepting chemotaxis protein [Phycisphaeraceae bacterium]